MNNMLNLSLIGLLASLLLVVGCGEKATNREIKGTVTIDGKSIEVGQISFFSADNSGVPATTSIQNGVYQLKVPYGKKKVAIEGSRYELVDGVNASGVKEKLKNPVPIVPEKYNLKSKLEANITVESKETLDFNLTSK
jgi:hypothetical protein